MVTNKDVMELEIEKSNGNGSTNYLTHNFHAYPAKFIPQIPKSTIMKFTKEGDVVLDPFCGCGTALIEAKLHNRNAIGVDLNPIAVLVSKAKTTPLSKYQIERALEILPKIKEDISRYYSNNKISVNYKIPMFNNINHWFQENVIHELAIIREYISNLDDECLKNYLNTAFSALIVSVSNQESDTRFAAKNKNIVPFKVIIEFTRRLGDMNKRMTDFYQKASNASVKVYQADSQKLTFLKDNSVDHIVTSPPYANTYDYYLYHKFRILWLGYNLKEVQDNEIGSRDKHSSKREEFSTFSECISNCLKEMSRILKPNKLAMIIIGDSVIRGKLICAGKLIEEIAPPNNFEVIREISYNLKLNSKMFNPKFTNGDKLEHVMVLRNVKERKC